ncbi:hypothetical protein CRYUN_Cryun17cG0108500 [Craigia yunnanensis]
MEFENPKLFVRQISVETDEASLTQHFSKYGEVKHVEVKPAKPKVEVSSRKIFVGGLPSTITLEEFKEYFASYGTITDAVVIYDKESHKFRGFGFVTYDSEEAAENVLRKNFHELNNKMVEVKRAKPKEKMKKDIDSHDYGSVSLPVPSGIYDINTQPGFNLPGGRYWYYYYPRFPVPYGYETGFGSYPVNGHANSNYGAPGSNW